VPQRRGRLSRATSTCELVAVRPYVLVYETAEDGAVSILRVWHAAQDR
jgi:toxin ParE1/3/4